VAGFAFGHGTGSQQLQHGIDRDDSRRTEGMVYAGLMGDRWYAQGRVGFGHVRQLIDRQLLLGTAAEGVWTRYDGRYQAAYGESGLRFGHGATRVAPFLSVEYARKDRDSFTEEGAGGFGLRSDAQSLDRWQAGIGVRAARHWNLGRGRTLDFGVHAQWRHTMGSNGDDIEASFVGLQQWAPLVGIGLSRYSGVFGVGLDARLSPRATLKFACDRESGQYDSASVMSVGLNLAF
jgi:fibronectin-binding autotransporter adhesin